MKRLRVFFGILGSFFGAAGVVTLLSAAWVTGCDQLSGKTEGEGRTPGASSAASAPQVAASAGTTSFPGRQDRVEPSRREATLSKESTAAPAERSPLSGPPVTTAAPSARSVVEQPALASPEKPPGARIYPKNVADKPVPRIGQQPWMIAEDWLLRHERQVRSPRRAHAKIVFLGDSIVEGWAMAPAFREHFGKYAPLNLGLAGDHTQNVLWRIDNGTLDGVEPDVVVVLVGINNLAGGFTPQQTVAGVRAVIGAVQAQLPSTTVVLLAILPARRSPTSPLRQKVTEANRMLANLAKPGSVSFHDVGSALLEPDETMSTITSRDALHPTPAGYDRLTAAVAPIVEELMRQ